MTNLDSILKSRDVTLQTKVHLMTGVVRKKYWLELVSVYQKGRKMTKTILGILFVGLQGDPTSPS